MRSGLKWLAPMSIVLETVCVSGHVATGRAQAGSQEVEWRNYFGVEPVAASS